MKAFLNEIGEFGGTHFENTWKKHDVLETGWIEIERMALFYKELLGDYTVNLQ